MSAPSRPAAARRRIARCHGRPQRHARLVLRRRPLRRRRTTRSRTAWRCTGRGADLVDVGGESTRPGADRVDADEELPPGAAGRSRELAAAGVRVASTPTAPRSPRPRWRPEPPSSTTSRGGLADPAWPRVVARRRLPVGPDALARAQPRHARRGRVRRRGHRRPHRAAARGSTTPSPRASTPRSWCSTRGSASPRTAAHNWALLAALDRLIALGLPLLVGASRKTFLGRLLAGADGAPRPVDGREAATTAPSPWSPPRRARGACGCTTSPRRSTPSAR